MPRDPEDIRRIVQLETALKLTEIKLESAERSCTKFVDEIEGWKRVAVIATMPLEALRISGSHKRMAPMVAEGIDVAVITIRQAIMGGDLPPPNVKFDEWRDAIGLAAAHDYLKEKEAEVAQEAAPPRGGWREWLRQKRGQMLRAKS